MVPLPDAGPVGGRQVEVVADRVRLLDTVHDAAGEVTAVGVVAHLAAGSAPRPGCFSPLLSSNSGGSLALLLPDSAFVHQRSDVPVLLLLPSSN